MILKQLLPSQEIKIAYDDYGKPFLESSSDSISVSHSGDFSAAIVSHDKTVGIDIEKVSSRIERIREKFLSPEELAGITGNHSLEMLYICWGAKESLYKLNGNPGLDFKKDIRIEPFEYLCIGEGQCKALMKVQGKVIGYDICYRKTEDYMLVYALGCKPGKALKINNNGPLANSETTICDPLLSERMTNSE
jgi:phosphopantetheinyl transferase